MMSGLPKPVQEVLREKLSAEIKDFSFVAGGCINSGGKLKTSAGDFFIKWNDREKFPGMFSAEAKGLKLLADEKSVRVPGVVFESATEEHQFLVLDWIESAPRKKDYWEIWGINLRSFIAKQRNSLDLITTITSDHYLSPILHQLRG